MQIKGLLVATALCAGTAMADFMAYSELPFPRDAIPTFTDPAEATGWTLSVSLAARTYYDSYTSSLGSTYQSSLTSARSAINEFARTASNYSIPAEVTDDSETTTFFSLPSWYSALPSAARSFKDRQVSDQYDAVRTVVARASSRSASQASDNHAAMPTPRAGLEAGLGAMAAVAAGIFL